MRLPTLSPKAMKIWKFSANKFSKMSGAALSVSSLKCKLFQPPKWKAIFQWIRKIPVFKKIQLQSSWLTIKQNQIRGLMKTFSSASEEKVIRVWRKSQKTVTQLYTKIKWWPDLSFVRQRKVLKNRIQDNRRALIANQTV
jgi:hypothetical protein